MDGLTPHLGSILTGLAALGTFLFAVYQWYVRRKTVAAKAWNTALTGKGEISDALEAVLIGAKADRVLLVAAHNGGAVAHAGLPLYISVLGEVTSSPLVPRVQARIQRFDLDLQYSKTVLAPLSEAPRHSLRPEDLPPGYWLRDLYEAQGIKTSQINFVADSREMKWVLVVQYTEDHQTTPAMQDAINYAVERLRRTVKG